MDTFNHYIREIAGADDPLWEDWYSIYLASFPVHERMSSGFFMDLLAAKASGSALDTHMLVMPGEDETAPAVCIALFQTDSEAGVACLWYLATLAHARGAGIGARMYEHIRHASRLAQANLVLFEVEIPEHAAARSAQDGEWAARRIAWYHRQGAGILHGIRYFQTVDTTDEVTEMHLMADRLEPLSTEEVFAKAKGLFGDALTQIGPFSIA